MEDPTPDLESQGEDRASTSHSPPPESPFVGATPPAVPQGPSYSLPERQNSVNDLSTKKKGHSLAIAAGEPAPDRQKQPPMGGEEASTTQEAGQLTVAVDVVAVGTPDIPNDEEDDTFLTQVSTASSLPLRYSMQEHSLLAMGGPPAPPSPESAQVQSFQGNQSSPNTASPSWGDNSGGFVGKLTRTQWGLAGAGVLIVILIIVIAVLVISGNSVGAPQPAPSGLIPPERPTQAPNPRMPTETGSTPQPTSSPTTVAPTSSPITNQPTIFVASKTVEVMMTRGVLLCGVSPGLEGFSVKNGNTYEGFEADLCRSLAGAVLGSPENVEFVEVETEDMFVALQLGSVDVLASHATHTMERDVFENSAQAGFTFSVPYLYDGLTFGGLPTYVDCANRLNNTERCTSLRICALVGSTHSDVVAELLPGTQLIPLPTMKGLYDTFDSGFCDVIAGDRFEVSEAAVRRNGYTGEYHVGEDTHSHEPLSLVTRNDDARWSDMVQWVVQALLAAEEKGVLMNTAESFDATQSFGDAFTNMFRNAISAVGNYGEMYTRHLESIVPRERINTINENGTGLIYSFPFGSLETIGPSPKDGSTLHTIRKRDLRCGVVRTPGFADYNTTTGWSGLDVDFCRAVAAAIFSGHRGNVKFTEVTAAERFLSLENGDIDVLSRTTVWNLQRDVMEPTSGVGFSFSPTNFYDGVAVGGIPPYGRCADILDTTSPACQDLKICVITKTTTINVARSRFLESFLEPVQTLEEVIGGLSNGKCNAIIGIGIQVAERSVRDHGYTGEYEIGQRQFSKDPLSMVTRHDDPQFTAFVNWIVTATFFAEEQGITQLTSTKMPRVELFGGPPYTRMLISAIEAVGNYGDMYARNVEPIVPRRGRNAMNEKPHGPQFYPQPTGE